ncbi:hypothetical protein DFJ73DRAFT_767721 [Zopfochytrium polystomum]|nr:hypothetical protein DFJ73DRAFT_767721 [Zopfochytrium polystomum]
MIDTSKIPNYDKHVDMRKHAKENKDYYTSTMETNVKKEKAKLFPTSIPAEACHLLPRRSAGAGGLYRRAGAGCKKGGGAGGGVSAKWAAVGGGGSARQAASAKPAAGGGKK